MKRQSTRSSNQKVKIVSDKIKSLYKPHVGYVGTSQVTVSNYLFAKTKKSKHPLGYAHNFKVAKHILNTPVSEHYRQSQMLTEFLRKRDLTFSKSTKSGSKTFTVPVSNTPVLLPKSTFDNLERAAQMLMIVLRKVAQSIYGAPSLHESDFIKGLPPAVQKIFIDAVMASPQYIQQLHHPVMKEYPFFDVVGLDLVLVEDYLSSAKAIPAMLNSGNVESLPELPFRLLEINAGSPSGAANNTQILEGMAASNSDLLNSFDKVLPNDHFETLAETYRSLGQSWTGINSGLAIILPPGGTNGATPEIQQLASKSGLLYVDPAQLYSDETGSVRLRTTTGNDPVVTSVYSRVNADSALFSLKNKISLRDQETGEILFLTDSLLKDENGKPKPVLNQKNEKIPLESAHLVPDCLDAIHNKRLYLGGLNRILDNKIILATLTHFGLDFYKEELQNLGFSPDERRLLPPETLEPKASSVEIIRQNPNDWVIKVPDGSGGKGVHILRALSPNQKKAVLAQATKSPTSYAYQKLVCIGRIPVAVKDDTLDFRFANLAADLRMWIFYGANGSLPKLTHNGLVRYASKERGKLSSIVNTSQGGGYAPLLIVDDINHPLAIDLKKHLLPAPVVPIATDAPLFVAAQILQLTKIIKELQTEIQLQSGTPLKISNLLASLIAQARELLAYIDSPCMEIILLAKLNIDRKLKKTDLSNYSFQQQKMKLQIVELVSSVEHLLPPKFFEIFETDVEVDAHKTPKICNLLLDLETKHPNHCAHFAKLGRLIARSAKPYQHVTLSKSDYDNLAVMLKSFQSFVSKSLSAHTSQTYGQLFSASEVKFSQTHTYQSLFYKNNESLTPNAFLSKGAMVASEYEHHTQTKLINTEFVSDEIKDIYNSWQAVLLKSKLISRSQKREFLRSSRARHLEKYPKVARMQAVLNGAGQCDISEMENILEALPYAKFNIERFCRQQNISFTELFTDDLKSSRVALLDEKALINFGLPTKSIDGECFAKKRSVQSLFHDSQLLVWVRKDLSAFVKMYTVGHELIHFQQIQEMMNLEKVAIQNGPNQFASFMNFYGSFLGLSAPAVAANAELGRNNRLTFFGLNDLGDHNESDPLLKSIFKAVHKSDDAFNEKLASYGSLLGWLVPSANSAKVKALREVIPALENGRNIRFAKDLGLEVNACEFKAMLPAANENQVRRLSNMLENVFTSAELLPEHLHLIANHQIYGVQFKKAKTLHELVTLKPHVTPLFLSQSYNSLQQQQQ